MRPAARRSPERAPRKAPRKSSRKSGDKTPEPSEPSEYESYYAVIRQIPSGQVMTYGDVARWAGRPTSARRVGYALFGVADPSVPWWRVLNARGEISRRHHSGPGGPEDEQRFLLLREGVEFDPRDRVDLDRFLFRPVSLRAQGSRRRPARAVR